MDTNTTINSNITMDEAAELAEVLTAEAEAHVVNDEIDAYVVNDEVDAHVVNDEIDAHKINDDLSQVAETFDALESDGMNIQTPEQSRMTDMMANYMSAHANHQPGKEVKYSDTTYTVQAHPHRGMWVKDKKQFVDKPNLKNNSVRRKLTKNPNKYIVSL